MTRDPRTSAPGAPGGTAAVPRWGGRSQSRDPVAVYLSPRLRRSIHTIEHDIRRSGDACALHVAAMLDLGAVERALEHARPVLVALERIRPQPVRELVAVASQADALEEPTEAAYLLRPCRETRRAWIAKLKRQYVTTLQLLTALEHEDATDVAALA